MAAKKKPATSTNRAKLSKKAPTKSSPRPAAKTKKAPAKKAPPKTIAKPKKTVSKVRASRPASRVSMPPPKPIPKGLERRAQHMAAFSQRVVEEETAPVAVRTFNELRAGIEESKKLDVRSGKIVPVRPAPEQEPVPAPAVTPAPEPARTSRPASPPPQPQPEADEDLEAEIRRDLEAMEQDSAPSPKPKIEPLTGQLAVPRRTNPLEEEFRVGASAKKGKKGAPPTKEDLGKIELRMQRGSKDEAIAHASPDYLQRSFNKAAQKGKTSATAGTHSDEAAKPDEFEVAMDKGQRRVDASLTDLGDVEIAQQTRSGRKKVGKLGDEEADEKSE